MACAVCPNQSASQTYPHGEKSDNFSRDRQVVHVGMRQYTLLPKLSANCRILGRSEKTPLGYLKNAQTLGQGETTA